MSLPRIDPAKVVPGDRVTVTVGGRHYDTVISDAGTQRFVEDPENALVRRLRENPGKTGNPAGDIADLNEMGRRYHAGEFDQRTYAEFNMATGYSLGGFRELSSFQDMDIDNPLEEADDYDPTDLVEVPATISRAAA